jgi:hypothetical protein
MENARKGLRPGAPGTRMRKTAMNDYSRLDVDRNWKQKQAGLACARGR